MKGKGEERGDLKKFDKMLKTVGLVDPTEKDFSAKKKKKMKITLCVIYCELRSTYKFSLKS